MTPRELFKKVEQKFGRVTPTIRYLIMTTPLRELYEPISPSVLLEFYEGCYRYLQQFGRVLTSGDEGHDAEVWEKATETLNCIQRILDEEFKANLPERKVVSMVDEMVVEGYLKKVQDEDGQECVAPEENPYDIKIRIVQTPPGQAPEKVRNGWIGVELLARFIPGVIPVRGLVTGSLEFKRDGLFQVPYQVAIEQLQQKAPTSAQWFIDNLGEFYPPLLFDVQCAEIIQAH